MELIFFTCDLCEAPFKSPEDCEEHVKYHTGQKYRNFPKFGCEKCGKVFGNYEKLNQHLYRHFGVFSCTQCDRKTQSFTEFQAHHVKVHENNLNAVEKKIEKDLACKNSGESNEPLDRHDRLYEIDPENLLEIMMIKTPNQMVHIKKSRKRFYIDNDDDFDHHDDENYEKKSGKLKCKFCEKYISQALFKYHMRWHKNPNAYRCNFCFKGFTFPTNLYTHLKTHQQEQDIWKCQFCSLTFYTVHAFHKHQKKCEMRPTDE